MVFVNYKNAKILIYRYFSINSFYCINKTILLNFVRNMILVPTHKKTNSLRPLIKQGSRLFCNDYFCKRANLSHLRKVVGPIFSVNILDRIQRLPYLFDELETYIYSRFYFKKFCFHIIYPSFFAF